MRTTFIPVGWILLLCSVPAVSQVHLQALPASSHSQVHNINIPLRSFEEVPSELMATIR